MRRKFLIMVMIAISFAAPIRADKVAITGNYDENGNWSGYIDDNVGYVPKVTSIHNLNAYLAKDNKVYYIPTKEDIPIELSDFVADSLDFEGNQYKFAAVYDGNYDKEALSDYIENSYKVSTKVYRENRQRALEILGYDFLLSNEDVEMSYNDKGELEANYVTSFIEDGKIDGYTAIMDIYKALGKYEYSTKLAFTEDKSLELESSPIQQKLQYRTTSLDTKAGSAWVFISRTNRQMYVDKAIQDYLDMSDSGLNKLLEHTDATTVSSLEVDSNLNKHVTLGGFCKILKEILIKYGEPVMSNEEEALLTQIYGKNIPYYLDKDILEAVKYLMCRGILNPDEKEYNYSGLLSVEDMLNILMAVRDANSRYTFKNIELTLDSTLRDLNYFEVEAEPELLPIVTISDNTTEASEYFDYYVEPVDGYTNFKQNVELKLDKFCLISNNGGKLKSSENGLFYFVGVTDDGFYHFRIKAGKSYLKKYITNSKYVKIGCMSKTDISYYRVELGGGVYYASTGYSDASLKALKRKIFDDVYPTVTTLVDSERKAKAQRETTGSDLAPATSIPIKFSLQLTTWQDDVKKLEWLEKVGDTSGTKLTALATDGVFTSPDGNYVIKKQNSANGLMFFSVTGCIDMADFRTHINQSNLNNRLSQYQMYCQNGSNILANFDFLQDVGIAKRYIQLNEDVILLTTPTNNIYLCSKLHKIVVGNVVYDVPEDTLLYYKKDGQLFIDYRAATGWSGKYYVFQKSNGNITLTMPDNLYEGSTHSKKIYNPMGTYSRASNVYGSNSSSLSTEVVTIQGYDYIQLSSTYPLANYIIYDGDDTASEYGDTDYLFVFKLRNQYYDSGKKVSSIYTDDKVARELLKQILKADAPEDWLVYCYQLHKESNKASANPPGILYDKAFGYLYKPYAYDSNWRKYYYRTCLLDNGNIKGTEADYSQTKDMILPFMYGSATGISTVTGAQERAIFNTNFNAFKIKGSKLAYGRAPYELLFKSSRRYNSKAVTWKPGYTDASVGSKSYGTLDNYEMILAPTGVVNAFVSAGIMESTEIDSMSSVIYLGTIKANVKKHNNYTSLEVADYDFGKLTELSFDKFNILRSTNLGYVLGLNSADNITALDSSMLSNADKPSTSKGISLSGFDWNKFTFRRLMETADDFITIAIIVLLNFIPRIAMFIFLLLMFLSLATNIKPWVLFCDHIFDIYKFLTLKRKDVHTINIFTMFWSSILGMSVFGLFMDGTIINIIAYMVKFVSSILAR